MDNSQQYFVLDYVVVSDDAPCVPTRKAELLGMLEHRDNTKIDAASLDYRTRTGLPDLWATFEQLLDGMIEDAKESPGPPAVIMIVWPSNARTSWVDFLNPFVDRHNVTIGHFKEQDLLSPGC